MTIKECIDLVDNVKPNQYGIEDKVEWLSYLDGTIINDVLKTHEGYDGSYDDFAGYSADKLSVPLIVQSPYDKLYTAYLKMKIDEENGETARYNNSATLFNSYMLEYRKHYNRTHMPLSGVCGRKAAPSSKPSSGISGTELENLKRELLAQLRADISAYLSQDKVYDVIMDYVAIHGNEFKGKDGYDGKNGKSAYEYAKDGGYTGTEADFMKKMAEESVASASIGEVTLLASAWIGEGNLYSQVVRINGVTENSQVDLTPSVEQLVIFYEKDLSFVTENDGGVVTVYAIGQKPQNDYTIQVTITEVQYD